MNKRKSVVKERKPLVLVIDDVAEYREKRLPDLLKSLGARVLKAGNLEQAIRVADKHAPQREGADPLDLVVLDMHVPIGAKKLVDADETAGIRFLEAIQVLRAYSLISPRCPVIVFTAYPSYENCVQAMKAGATAYVPKVTVDDDGPERLDTLCRQILGAERVVPVAMDEWKRANLPWVRATFAGRWVSFVPEGAVRNIPLPRGVETAPARHGVVVLHSRSYESLREVILVVRTVCLDLPLLVRIAGELGTPQQG